MLCYLSGLTNMASFGGQFSYSGGRLMKQSFLFTIFLFIFRFLPGGNLTDHKDITSHYDYSHLGQTNTPGTPNSVSQGFGHVPHESMYYPPPLYPAHHTSPSVHSTHHLWWWDHCRSDSRATNHFYQHDLDGIRTQHQSNGDTENDDITAAGTADTSVG